MRARNPQGIHLLSPIGVQNLASPGWHSDGGGLYLEVADNGRKRWAMRITVNGRRRDFGLGPLHKVSLATARQLAAGYREKAYLGLDPTADKKEKKLKATAMPTFEKAAKTVHETRRKQWKNGKHVDQWINTLEQHAFPHIGKRPVSEITTADVLAVLTPIWTTKQETARRVRQRLSVVLEWARAAGYRSGDNPVELIGDALPRNKKEEKHHPALPYDQVADFIGKLRAGAAEQITKLAFEFLILTAARTIEVRKGRKDEIDEKTKTWTIPGDDEETGRRMKAGRMHVVPLSDRCMEILKEAAALFPDSELLFPEGDKPLSENRFLNARDALGYAADVCTPHGFRSSFRDWAAEETNFPSDVAEMALSHVIKDKTEAAYRRGKLLAKRALLMKAWAKYALPRA